MFPSFSKLTSFYMFEGQIKKKECFPSPNPIVIGNSAKLSDWKRTSYILDQKSVGQKYFCNYVHKIHFIYQLS